MIVVKKGYYYLDEVRYYCIKNRKYLHFLTILDSLKQQDAKYVSSFFFQDSLAPMKNELTDINGLFSLTYFHFNSNVYIQKALEYFDYKRLKYYPKLKAVHIYNKEITDYIKKGYIINFLSYEKDINRLRRKNISILDYKTIIVLKNKINKNAKNMYLGVWK